MPNLISASERAVLTGIFDSIFETFQRSITIHRVPTKTIDLSSPQNEMSFGFGMEQQNSTVTYNEETGVYPAMIRYAKSQPAPLNSELNAFVPEGEVSIKVRRDCRDFILAAPVEKIVFDEKQFVLVDDERKKTFLDSEFWIFYLKAQK